jgi:hypothetical protein
LSPRDAAEKRHAHRSIARAGRAALTRGSTVASWRKFRPFKGSSWMVLRSIEPATVWLS